MRKVATAFALCLVFGQSGWAEEPMVVDLIQLNQRIGTDYVAEVPYDSLLANALSHRLVLYGEAHDQEGAARQFLKLLDAIRASDPRPLRIGVEFVDRDDGDILQAYLKGVFDEEQFRQRLMPTSLLLSPRVGSAHMNLLRYARYHELDIVPLESRPAGARPSALRNSEIRWNLAQELGRYPEARLLVLYGVNHVLGVDPITEGLELPCTVITSYGDSVQTRYRDRHGIYPLAGALLKLRRNVYLQSVGEPSARQLLQFDFEARDELLTVIESVYFGGRNKLQLLVEALMDPEIRWRRAAFHALGFVAEEDFAYDPEAPKSARRAAQKRWRSWLEEVQAPNSMGAR